MRQNVSLVGALLSTAGIAATSTAPAQEAPYEAPYVEQGLAAPTNAFELKINTGYTQGWGNIAPNRSVNDVAGAGLGIDLDADYRADPHWSIGLQGEYQEFAANRAAAARGFAGNIGGTYHVAPMVRGDPWFRLGTGYRGLWEVNPILAPTTFLHGFELGKLTIGYDLRVSREVALAPQIGADVNLFVWRNVNNINTQLSSAQVGSFIFAGLQGRFDMAGEMVSKTKVANR
jgi:hypothetical protein